MKAGKKCDPESIAPLSLLLIVQQWWDNGFRVREGEGERVKVMAWI